MDGSNSSFLRDDPQCSWTGSGSASGVLYVEDFGVQKKSKIDHVPVEAPGACYSDVDMAAALELGRQQGLQEALTEVELLQSLLRSAAAHSMADALHASRTKLEEVARGYASELSQTMLVLLTASLPVFMRQQASGELEALLATLQPELTCLPNLRARAHPQHAEFVRETLIAMLPGSTCVIAVCADETLDVGDITIEWQRGGAKRDCNAIWARLVAAMHSFNLPSFEDILYARG